MCGNALSFLRIGGVDPQGKAFIMSAMMVRWGIVGCGDISSDFTLALTSLPKDEHKVIHYQLRGLK